MLKMLFCASHIWTLVWFSWTRWCLYVGNLPNGAVVCAAIARENVFPTKLTKKVKHQECMWIYSRFRLSWGFVFEINNNSECLAVLSMSWRTGPGLAHFTNLTSRCTLRFSGRSAQGEPIWALLLWCGAATFIQEHREAVLCCTGRSEVNWLPVHRVDGHLSQLVSVWQFSHCYCLKTSSDCGAVIL